VRPRAALSNHSRKADHGGCLPDPIRVPRVHGEKRTHAYPTSEPCAQGSQHPAARRFWRFFSVKSGYSGRPSMVDSALSRGFRVAPSPARTFLCSPTHPDSRERPPLRKPAISASTSLRVGDRVRGVAPDSAGKIARLVEARRARQHVGPVTACPLSRDQQRGRTNVGDAPSRCSFG
jgi:hypothetical protein